MNVNINDVRISDRKQRLFPNIAFTCNGSITKWIVGAKTYMVGLFPELQIWRNTGGSSYNKANFSMVSSSTQDSNNIVEYNLSTPLEFLEGDILGVYQPRREDSALVVYYQERDGPVNFQNHGMLDSALTTVNLYDLQNRHDYPLVTVEISTGKLMPYVQMHIIMIALHYHANITIILSIDAQSTANVSFMITNLYINHCITD